MIAEFPSLNNLAACLFMLFIFYWSASRLVFIISIMACLFKQSGCLYYLEMVCPAIIVCLIVNASVHGCHVPYSLVCHFGML